MHHDTSGIQQQRRTIEIESEETSGPVQPSQGQRNTGRKKIEIKEGQTFGRLTAVCLSHKDKHNHPIWNFNCSCGGSKEISGINVFKGLTKSCGCLRRENTAKMKTSHGLSKTPEYETWCGMKRRCYNPNCKEFRLYGARGISICEDWIEDFQSFYHHIGPRPSILHSIDRIDNDGNYEPGNVWWATDEDQANNSRRNTILICQGKSKTMAQWARHVGLAYDVLCQRICKLGWSHEEAILTPKLFTC